MVSEVTDFVTEKLNTKRIIRVIYTRKIFHTINPSETAMVNNDMRA